MGYTLELKHCVVRAGGVILVMGQAFRWIFVRGYTDTHSERRGCYCYITYILYVSLNLSLVFPHSFLYSRPGLLVLLLVLMIIMDLPKTNPWHISGHFTVLAAGVCCLLANLSYPNQNQLSP